MLALWIIAVAAAQSEAAIPRPAVESASLLTVEGARAQTGWGLSARAYGLGDPLTPSLSGAHLSLAGGYGPGRLGLDAPIDAGGLGAPRLSGRLIAPWGIAERPGLGLWGAVILSEDAVGELGLLTDAQLGLVTGALTLGLRGGGVGPEGFGRVGASVAVFEALDVSAEVHLDAPGLSALSWSAVGAARAQLGPWASLRLGVGWRPEDDALSAILGLSLSARSAADGDRDGVKDERDACPRRAEDEDGFEDDDGCPDPDNDQDGLADDQDACPEGPAPGSDDGCPVGLGLVRVRLVWAGAAPDALAELRLTSADPDAPSQLIRGLGADVELTAGAWTLEVTAPGMLPAQRALSVPGGGALDVELTLSPDPTWSTQRLQIVNAQGQPVEAVVRVDGARRPAPGGALDLRLPPGPATVSVEAIGYRGEVLRLSPAPGVDRVQQVILTPLSRVYLTDGQLMLREPLRFAPGTATLTPASQAVLDEVGSILRAQPELGVVRVEGYCELYGDEDQDITLSQAQADAVVTALIARGLSPDRLLAVGFGPPDEPQEGIRQSARFFIETPEPPAPAAPPAP